MDKTKFLCPPPAASGSGTFSDDLVGLQLVTGGGLTQGNFQFTSAIFERDTQTFDIGVFSSGITLSSMGIENIEETKKIIQNNFKVFPNFDLSQITSFSLYGSLSKRLSSSITKVINYFPAALEIESENFSLFTGETAFNILYDPLEDTTSFDVNVFLIRNPLSIDYSVNASLNIQASPYKMSKYRDLNTYQTDYSLFFTGLTTEFKVTDFTPTQSLSSGTLNFVVKGNPFSGQSSTTEKIIIKPNIAKTEEIFKNDFDVVESYLINRNTVPLYTSTYSYQDYDSDGVLTNYKENVTWQIDGSWNLDIRTDRFTDYLEKLQSIGEAIDENKTNLISRFLTAGSLKEFDTFDQKVEKTLQIYGRSFDETKKFIDALAYMNSVNYVVGNDIPSQLLVNLASTLGFKTNITPLNNEDLLNSVFSTSSTSPYIGQSVQKTPLELNYQYFRNLILNAAFLFKSKGTRKSIEYILRMVGAPEALIEFNEYVYLADQKISINDFEEKYANISGGTIVSALPEYQTNNVFSLYGIQYTGYSTEIRLLQNPYALEDFPINIESGYPERPNYNDDFYYQKGSGWFERTPEHTTRKVIDQKLSDFSQTPAIIKTSYIPFSYGNDYLERYRRFPFLNLGYGLTKTIDNKKSWDFNQTGLRKELNSDSPSYYVAEDDRLVLNVKNMELYLNMGQGITYDIWESSSNFGYPIPNSAFTAPYPTPGLNDWTVVDPQPNKKTFFEFAQTFYNNMINVRNRQTISDGKTGGYPTLQSIFWRYLQSEETVGIPNNKFTYQKMIDFTLGLGDYWVRLVEQFVPATTIWNTGQKFDNSVFHRQKVVWRRQRGCTFVNSLRNTDCLPCIYNGQPFNYDCIDQTTSCNIPSFDPINVLSLKTQEVLNNNSYTVSQCDSTTIISNWYVKLSLVDLLTTTEDNLINEIFYTGYGQNALDPNTGQALTYSQVLNAIDQKLQYLYQYGLNYYLNGGTLTVSNSSCYDNFTNKQLKLFIGLDIQINCN
jgi:hypothetical protein